MKLIDKDAVLAELEKIIADENESIKSFEHGKNVSEVQRSNARIGVLMHLRSLLDTFDAKEVDLGKELKDWMQDNTDTAGFFDTEELAKHFFELGLKAQKGEEV